MQPFVRQVGYQSAVQLNPLKDNTDGVASGIGDQVFAMAARLRRGRIDIPFSVDRTNYLTKTGQPQSIRESALNEAHVQGYMGLQHGARSIVMARLSPAAAVISWINYTAGATSTFAVSSTADVAATFSVKHLGCFNDGVKLSVHCDSKESPPGTFVAGNVVRVKVIDVVDGATLYDITGSLDPLAVDEFGQSFYISDVSSAQTDDLVWNVKAASTVGITSDSYGKDSGTGRDKYVTSTAQLYFAEGGTTYANSDYDRVLDGLKATPLEFGYVASGGTKAVALLGKLAQLGYDINKQFGFDIDGALTPSAAITFIGTLGFDSHYCQAYYSPNSFLDPLNGGRATIGLSAHNLALRCRRNSVTNAYGFAAKNYPVAGKEFPIEIVGLTPLFPKGITENERSDLAFAKINPVVYEAYNGGSKFVYLDSLTCAKTLVSFKKLIAVADMSSWNDDYVTKVAKEALQLPMKEAVKRTYRQVRQHLLNAQFSDWLVPSEQLEGGAAFELVVQPNAAFPADRMDISYKCRYDGTTRVIFVQQTLAR